MKKMKTGTIILIVVCFVGLCALLYPTVADYWNKNIATSAISKYVDMTVHIKKEDYQKYWSDAIQYNKDLLELDNVLAIPESMQDRYNRCLNVNGLNIMGYIDIPKINVSLPIYHGTSDTVLSNAVGHLDWTSLPTGGPGTHCCLSGHRGLVKAKLFSDLDMLHEGDYFTLKVLNETLTYEVDQIRTVEPDVITDLAIEEDKDYCTLITCTPYGINTHRLLVRGHRIDNIYGDANVVSEAVQIDQLIVAVILAVPILFALFMMVMLKKPEPSKKKIEQMIKKEGGNAE